MSLGTNISNLVSFKIEDLEESFFMLGDFYVERKNSSALKLFKAGDFIDKIKLQKYQKTKHGHFYYEPFIHRSYVNEGIELWDSFRKAESEDVRQNFRVLIMKWFCRGFWDGEEEVSLLDLIYVQEKVFWRFERTFIEEYWNTSTMLLRRSVLLSSLVVPVCLAAGYTDFNYLSDVCHTTCLIDCSFEMSNFSYLIAKAIEQERKGDQTVCSSLVEFEQSLYNSHPKMSYEKAILLGTNCLNDKSVLHLILKHHEKTNGTGWPQHLSENNSSDVENILISLNQILPYEEKYYNKTDGQSFLKKLVTGDSNPEIKSLPVKRLEMLLNSVFISNEICQKVI